MNRSDLEGNWAFAPDQVFAAVIAVVDVEGENAHRRSVCVKHQSKRALKLNPKTSNIDVGVVRRRGKFPHVSEDRVRVQIGAGGVATVRMVRAGKHNALDQAMFEGLIDAAGRLAGEASVRAVVLHGEGKSFCSGLDVASFMSGQGGTGVLLERQGDRLANFAQRVAYDWSLVPAPVIAAIHGNCFGGGLQIALGTDIRIAAPDANLDTSALRPGGR